MASFVSHSINYHKYDEFELLYIVFFFHACGLLRNSAAYFMLG